MHNVSICMKVILISVLTKIIMMIMICHNHTALLKMFYLIRKERIDAFSHKFWTTQLYMHAVLCEMSVTTFRLVQQFVSRLDSVRSPSEMYISLHLYLCKGE